jgi:hypothetical protein
MMFKKAALNRTVHFQRGGHSYLIDFGDLRTPQEKNTVCRNIRTLFNFEPPATDAEIYAASLQFVRKISGFNKPSAANQAAFSEAVDDIARISGRLLDSLLTASSPKNRDDEAVKAKARSAERYAR